MTSALPNDQKIHLTAEPVEPKFMTSLLEPLDQIVQRTSDHPDTRIVRIMANCPGHHSHFIGPNDTCPIGGTSQIITSKIINNSFGYRRIYLIKCELGELRTHLKSESPFLTMWLAPINGDKMSPELRGIVIDRVLCPDEMILRLKAISKQSGAFSCPLGKCENVQEGRINHLVCTVKELREFSDEPFFEEDTTLHLDFQRIVSKL